jgi:type VI protein secretion system component Hcp
MTFARSLALLLALALTHANPPHAFLQLPGIKGSSTDPAHVGWIVITSATWTTGATRSAAGVAARTLGLKQVRITKETDQSSPGLSHAAAKGTQFATATIDIGGKRYLLKTVTITAMKQAGPTGSAHAGTDEITLEFASYTEQMLAANGKQSDVVAPPPLTVHPAPSTVARPPSP